MRLGGSTEVAKELGISRQRVAQLRGQPGFPEPAGEIAAGTIWDLDAVQRWSSSGLRRTSGRPSKEAVLLAERYLLDDEPIASGGFADVYRATDISKSDHEPNAVVAVKRLREFKNVEIRRRFQRELRLVAEVSHPNIVQVLNHGEEPSGGLWYAMPLATGSLMEAIDQFPGDSDRIAQVMGQICDGVAFVHGKGIFHRDLKPPNVLLVGHDTWAISDFGLAREEERKTTILTGTLQGVGTQFYAAPEAWRGAREAEAPADVFSLGKMLHALILGEHPVSTAPPEGIYRHVVLKATKDRPDQRYKSVAEFRNAVETAATTPTNWQSTDDRTERWTEELSLERPDSGVVRDLMIRVNSDPSATIDQVAKAIPYMSRPAVELAWAQDPDAVRSLVSGYRAYIDEHSFDFGFCDYIANFLERASMVTGDVDVLAESIRALIDLGFRHNRWHVRTVAIRLFQDIRDTPTALALSAAIGECDPDAVRFTFSDFAARSFHPALRKVIEGITSGSESGG